MKIFNSFAFLIAVITAFPSFGQTSREFINAIKTVDMATVESFMQDKVEFCIKEDQQVLSKAAASTKLKAFLVTNKPISIELMHHGNSKDKASQYQVAKLVTNQGTYRMFIYSEGAISVKSVKEIRIDNF